MSESDRWFGRATNSALALSACAILAILSIATSAHATTLTITPDKSTYQVGETITLSVLGDAEGASASGIFGRILFDGSLASVVSSSQVQITSIGGLIPWITFTLSSGDGFADAFNQTPSVNPFVPDAPVSSTIVLLATTPGPLSYSWLTDGGSLTLDFFGLTSAPGGSVTIVPEPATVLLLGIGLVGLGLKRPASKR